MTASYMWILALWTMRLHVACDKDHVTSASMNIPPTGTYWGGGHFSQLSLTSGKEFFLLFTFGLLTVRLHLGISLGNKNYLVKARNSLCFRDVKSQPFKALHIAHEGLLCDKKEKFKLFWLSSIEMTWISGFTLKTAGNKRGNMSEIKKHSS